MWRYSFRLCLSLFLCVFLSACTYKHVHLLEFGEKTFQISTQNAEYILYISRSEDSYIFVMFDVLGSPVVHREFDGQFRSVRFLPPNSSFDDVFYRILQALQDTQGTIHFTFQNIRVSEID